MPQPKGYKWYDDGLVLRKFALALIEVGMLNDDEITTFLDKPWRYNNYHEIWEENGAPETNEDDGYQDFVDAITEQEEEEEEEEE